MSGEPNFWNRRLAGVAAEAEAEEAAIEARAIAEEQQALADKSDAEILVALDLPDPDDMQIGDDFTAFMSKAVPDHIRRRALRTLWRSNPVLANVDMLVDYGEDFTDKAMVVENLQTAYQIGKGMLKHVEEMARQIEERENPPELEPEMDAEADDVVMAAAVDDEPIATQTFVEPEPDMQPDQDIDDAPIVTPTPRRMKFKPEETAA